MFGEIFANGKLRLIAYVILSQSYFIYDLNKDLDQKTNSIKETITILDSKINQQQIELNKDISNLRKESASALNSLSSDLDELRVQSSESKKAISKLSEGLKELENVQIEANQDFSLIVEDVIDAVVSIRTENNIGSGVFVSPKYLITNYHVVDNANTILITTVDGTTKSAELIGYEPNVDIAVLEVANGNFNYLEFEDMDNVKVGERVIAIGSPSGLSFSVTQGIVSSKNRTGPNNLDIYIQTDAPINPGNSGGPLVNIDKKIAAINTWKIANVEGLGFSIQADTVKEVYDGILAQI